MKKCPNCGAQVNDDSLFCTECGKPISQGSVCPHCGASVNEGDAFCQNCGKSINGSPNEEGIINDEEKKTYLKKLFKTTYFKDIIEHNKLNKSEALDELCDIISDSVGGLVNAEKISNTYQSIKKEIIDKSTVTKYINYFIDAFIIQEAKRYDVKGRKEIGAQRKYYFSDLGLRNARLNFSQPDEGSMIENIVYNELVYNGYTVNVGTYEVVEKNKESKSIRKTYEIDFLATKGNKTFYVQVANDISKLETLEREKRPYSHLKDPIQKVLVVNKPFKEMRDKEGYILIGVTDFLLRFIK